MFLPFFFFLTIAQVLLGRTFCSQSTYTPRRAGSADPHPRPGGEGGRRGSRGEEGAQQVAVYVGVKHSTATSPSCLCLLRRAGDMAAHGLLRALREVWITCTLCVKLRQTARPVFVSKTAALWGCPRARTAHSRTHGRSKYKKKKKKIPDKFYRYK